MANFLLLHQIGNVAKWVNSLAVRIPQHLAKELELIAGVQAKITQLIY